MWSFSPHNSTYLLICGDNYLFLFHICGDVLWYKLFLVCGFVWRKCGLDVVYHSTFVPQTSTLFHVCGDGLIRVLSLINNRNGCFSDFFILNVAWYSSLCGDFLHITPHNSIFVEMDYTFLFHICGDILWFKLLHICGHVDLVLKT